MTSSRQPPDLATALRNRRDELGHTYKEAAAALGTERFAYIWRWEHGEVPRAQFVGAMFDYLDLDARDFARIYIRSLFISRDLDPKTVDRWKGW